MSALSLALTLALCAALTFPPTALLTLAALLLGFLMGLIKQAALLHDHFAELVELLAHLLATCRLLWSLAIEIFEHFAQLGEHLSVRHRGAPVLAIFSMSRSILSSSRDDRVRWLPGILFLIGILLLVLLIFRHRPHEFVEGLAQFLHQFGNFLRGGIF